MMDEFDKEFKKAKKIMVVVAIFWLALVVFVVWVIVKLLQHIGVI